MRKFGWALALVGLVLVMAVAVLAEPVLRARLPRAAGTQTAPAPYLDLPPAEFRALLSAGGATVVNVHVPDEGAIPGTNLTIPYDRIEQEAGRLPADRSAPIALYCISGRMSDIAARKLASLGYTRLYNLKGGMLAWEQAGLPLTGKSK